MSPALLLLAATAGAAPTTDIRVPPGFTATLYADHHAANDIYTMTIDDAGRVLVASRGYVKVLDGNKAIDILDGLKEGPMGLLAEGDSLFVVVDGGLKRYRGYNGRDRLTKPPETILAVKTAGEHDAHAVRRGPDGWLYLLCGNMAGMGKAKITSHRSPIADPIAGSLVRISPDGKDVEVVADGFRNAYDFDFNLAGEPFTYDSDNERCVGLPWYEPCRFYHAVPGGNYGWRSPQLSQTWRKPPYFPDVVPPVCTLGRGSPTGVACYRHTHFPKEYQGGFFLADWTFGRVHFVPLTPKGSTWTGTPKVFAEAMGENGFAPTALAVHPKTGELFVSIGGRGTRGGVYRISHDGATKGEPLPMAKRSLDWNADALTGATSDNALSRRQALDLLFRHRTELNGWKPLVPAVKGNLAHPDPLVRAAAGRLSVRAGVALGLLDSPQERITLALALATDDPEWALNAALGVLETPTGDVGLALQATRVVQLALGDLTSRDAVGTGWEGYTLRKTPKKDVAERVQKALKPHLLAYPHRGPKSSRELDREIARTAAVVGADDSNPWLAPGVCRHLGLPTSSVLDDLHYLAAAGRLTPYALRDEDGRIMIALLNLHSKMQKEKLNSDRHWPMRVDELAAALIPNHRYIPDRLRQYPDLGRPEHLPIVKHLKLDPITRARLYLTAASKDKDYPWTPGVIQTLAPLAPYESRPVLLKAWERGGLDDAILPLLAVAPEPADVPRFVAGLKSFDADVVRVSAGALAKLPSVDDQADVIAAIRALRRLPEDKAAATARDAVVSFLEVRTKAGRTPPGRAANDWTWWFNRTYPHLSMKLSGSDGFDAAAWTKRNAAIPWDAGDATAGKVVFSKASCAACHDGGRAVGPSLLGVAKRFGRDDLLTTLLEPNKDVSPRYRPTRVVTTDGKAHVGMIVYEAVDGVILQTGADTTVRVAGENIESKKTVDTSLMPAGLLDKLTDREVADLMAYLRSLGDGK